MIELRNIETFFWVATLGSFRAASDKLNTTQPAVSQRIASLEADLGVRLFERDARGVKLTAKGHELLSHAERMLQVRRDMFEAAREQNVMTGTVRIGVAETIVQTWLPTLIELIHTTYPALVLEIEVDTTHVLRPHLMSRQIDLAFLMGPVLEARVENLPLCSYPLAWVASPTLDLGPEPLTLERIAKLP
ncbi:LysR family transcriptional regulator, partial [Achromobacter piechaudii]